MIGLSEHSWKISWDANEVKGNWVIAFWSNLFRLRDIKSLFLDRKSDKIDELKIEDLKQQFIADVDQCTYLPYWTVSTQLRKFLNDSPQSFTMFYSLFLILFFNPWTRKFNGFQ